MQQPIHEDYYCEECGDLLTDYDMKLPCSRHLCNHCYLHTSDEED